MLHSPIKSFQASPKFIAPRHSGDTRMDAVGLRILCLARADTGSGAGANRVWMRDILGCVVSNVLKEIGDEVVYAKQSFALEIKIGLLETLYRPSHELACHYGEEALM